MKLSFYSLTKDQTHILKAIAIILIVLHNYLHWTNSIGQNEMQFHNDSIYKFIDSIKGNLNMLPNAIFTYLGHYGVQIFVFISGFGLCKMSIKKGKQLYKQYITDRCIKLFALLIYGVICYFLIFHIFIDRPFRDFLKVAFYSLLIIKTFSYEYLFRGVGPWWYFSLAFQLYVIFPFLYSLIRKNGEKGVFLMITLSLILIYILLPFTERINFPLFGNFIGHLPEFILGIAFACFNKLYINGKLLILATIIFILSCFYEPLFPLSFICVLIVLLSICYPIINVKNKKVLNSLIFIGKISMFMFIINGPLRAFTLAPFRHESAPIAFLGSLLQLFLVIIVSYIMYLIYNIIRNILNVKLNIKI